MKKKISVKEQSHKSYSSAPHDGPIVRIYLSYVTTAHTERDNQHIGSELRTIDNFIYDFTVQTQVFPLAERYKHVSQGLWRNGLRVVSASPYVPKDSRPPQDSAVGPKCRHSVTCDVLGNIALFS